MERPAPLRQRTPSSRPTLSSSPSLPTKIPSLPSASSSKTAIPEAAPPPPFPKYIIENATIMNRGHKIELTAISEAIGRTDRVMSVSFDNSGLTAFAQADADSESAVDLTAFIPESLQQRNFRPFGGLLAPPSFRQDTDRRGQIGNMNSNPKPKFRPFQWLRQRN